MPKDSSLSKYYRCVPLKKGALYSLPSKFLSVNTTSCQRHDNVLPAYLALPHFLRAHRYQPSATITDTAFALGHRADAVTFFDWLQSNPVNAQYFHEFMSIHRTGVRTWSDEKDAAVAILEVLREQDHPEANLFVDVGGGMGQQCKVSCTKFHGLFKPKCGLS